MSSKILKIKSVRIVCFFENDLATSRSFETAMRISMFVKNSVTPIGL